MVAEDFVELAIGEGLTGCTFGFAEAVGVQQETVAGSKREFVRWGLWIARSTEERAVAPDSIHLDTTGTPGAGVLRQSSVRCGFRCQPTDKRRRQTARANRCRESPGEDAGLGTG